MERLQASSPNNLPPAHLGGGGFKYYFRHPNGSQHLLRQKTLELVSALGQGYLNCHGEFFFFLILKEEVFKTILIALHFKTCLEG